MFYHHSQRTAPNLPSGAGEYPQGGPAQARNPRPLPGRLIADLPSFRQKALLHILDGVKGGNEDGLGLFDDAKIDLRKFKLT